MKYILAFEHPYYPEIEIYEDRQEVKKRAKEILKNEHVEDGEHK